MDNRKDVYIVIAATIFFGFFSKVTVNMPYMVWGYFDQFFLLSLLWWFLYTGALYVAIREYTQNIDSYFRVFGQAAIICYGTGSAAFRMRDYGIFVLFCCKAEYLFMEAFLKSLCRNYGRYSYSLCRNSLLLSF